MWGYSFGPLLAIEATVAFFLESTFIAVWAFGWKRLSPKAHALCIWLVAFASSLSAVWILIANSWMQHPVGYVMKDGKPVLSDLMAAVTQAHAILTILHTLAGAYIVAGFFVMGISAYHLLRKQFTSLFTKSFRIALTFSLIFSIFAVVEGHMHGSDLADKQPAKLAALESQWETGPIAPVFIVAVPDEKNARNSIEIGLIPGALSMLAFHNLSAPVKGLRDIPKDERPPVTATFISFRSWSPWGCSSCSSRPWVGSLEKSLNRSASIQGDALFHTLALHCLRPWLDGNRDGKTALACLRSHEDCRWGVTNIGFPGCSIPRGIYPCLSGSRYRRILAYGKSRAKGPQVDAARSIGRIGGKERCSKQYGLFYGVFYGLSILCLMALILGLQHCFRL